MRKYLILAAGITAVAFTLRPSPELLKSFTENASALVADVRKVLGETPQDAWRVAAKLKSAVIQPPLRETELRSCGTGWNPAPEPLPIRCKLQIRGDEYVTINVEGRDVLFTGGTVEVLGRKEVAGLPGVYALEIRTKTMTGFIPERTARRLAEPSAP